MTELKYRVKTADQSHVSHVGEDFNSKKNNYREPVGACSRLCILVHLPFNFSFLLHYLVKGRIL